MKFFDILKISLHNMWNNKTRTLLVTLVLFILSTLVTMILSFSIDMMELINSGDSANSDAIDLCIRYNNYSGEEKNLEETDLNYIDNQIIKPNKDLFTSKMYNASRGMVHIKDMYNSNASFVEESTNPFEGITNNLVAGRMWNKNDANKQYVWIDLELASERNYQVGSKIAIEVDDRRGNRSTYQYEIKGILQTFDLSTYGYCETNMIIGASNIKTLGVTIDEVKLYTSGLIKRDIFDIMNVVKIAKAHNKFHYEKNPDGISVASERGDMAQNSLLMTAIVIGAAVFLSIIVILLSIGCVSNSIQITVEQNRKFFGVMKAVGLRDNTVKKIVRWQAVIMIILAVLGASGVSVGILFAVKPLILKGMAGMLGTTVEVGFGLPIYVPFIVLFLLVSLVLISTRRSLNKISKMDVVSVISEVN